MKRILDMAGELNIIVEIVDEIKTIKAWKRKFIVSGVEE